MRNTAWYSGVFLTVVLVMAGSIWGPEALAKYKDLSLLPTSEPTRPAEIPYAAFCLKKK